MKVTLTGIDAFCDHKELGALLYEHPTLEFGILYSATNYSPRYPGRATILEFVRRFPHRCALHICGRGARLQLLEKKLCDITNLCSRIQVNGEVEQHELTNIITRDTPQLITQWAIQRDGTRLNDLVTRAATPAGRHAILVDGSGGRGIRPKRWEAPPVNKSVGFAGGLNPGNVYEVLHKLEELKQFDSFSWIDAETGLRTDDRFDIRKADEFLKQVTLWAS